MSTLTSRAVELADWLVLGAEFPNRQLTSPTVEAVGVILPQKEKEHLKKKNNLVLANNVCHFKKCNSILGFNLFLVLNLLWGLGEDPISTLRSLRWPCQRLGLNLPTTIRLGITESDNHTSGQEGEG